jgi:hypothetical protein
MRYGQGRGLRKTDVGLPGYLMRFRQFDRSCFQVVAIIQNRVVGRFLPTKLFRHKKAIPENKSYPEIYSQKYFQP